MMNGSIRKTRDVKVATRSAYLGLGCHLHESDMQRGHYRVVAVSYRTS
jgi:hypothetical protein